MLLGNGANSAAEGVHSWQTGGRINSWGKSWALVEQHDLGPLRIGNLGGQMRLVDAAKKKKPPPFSESGFPLDSCVVSLEVDQRTELHVLEVLELNGSGARAVRDVAIDDAIDVHRVPLISQFAGGWIRVRPKILSVRLRQARSAG